MLAAKVDGSTKEDLTWGFRTGFVTLGARGLGDAHYEALTRKLMGAVRSSVSNSSVLAQSIVLRAVRSPSYEQEKREAYEAAAGALRAGQDDPPRPQERRPGSPCRSTPDTS